MNVSQASLAPFGYSDPLSVLLEVGECFAGIRITHQSSDGDPDGLMLTAVTVLVLAPTVLTAVRANMGAVPEVEQGGQPRGCFDENMSAVAAIASGGTAARDKFLPTKSHASVSAGTGRDGNLRLIDEFHQWLRGGERQARRSTPYHGRVLNLRQAGC
jgi:hypothetical protein